MQRFKEDHMKIALLHVMPQDQFRSIDVYAHRLYQSLNDLHVPDLEIFPMVIDAWSWKNWKIPTFYGRSASLRTLGIYLSRWIKYP